MEKIKVNMSPNPLDVQTIHASQNDGEARQWEFELHNNGDAIDSSSISDQLVFKAYKGGTEEILPTNGSTPTTSPFKGDIKYPQGLLSDQEFLYRESPTEEDGLAKITDIKGNTLVWNQLVTNGNFVNTDNWVGNGTITVSNNTMTYEKPSGWNALNNSVTIPIVADHKYLVTYSAYVETNTAYLFWTDGTGSSSGAQTIYVGTTWQNYSTILTATRNITGRIPWFDGGNAFTLHLKNYMFIDLTMMGLESLTLDEVKEWLNAYYPLPYYAYNQGILLSFNGNGIKTVGKNRLNYDAWKTVETYNGTSVWENNGVTITATGGDAYTQYSPSAFPVNARIPVQAGKTITLSWESDDVVNGSVFIFPRGSAIGSVSINNRIGKSLSYTPVEEIDYVTIRFGVASAGNTIHFKNIMVRFADTDDTFEPYTTQTTSLPIATYFPTGMKSAGTVYDELTPRKAITRIGAVNLGSLTWSYNEQYQCFTTYPVLTDSKYVDSAVVPNFTSIYKAVSWSVGATDSTQDMAACFLSSANQLRIRNKNFTDATAFTTAMSGVYLYYELATPTETSFTTASLVTENAEIPLSNEDGVLIGKCTEQLSENPGFIDAKIKLADADGECYSNKIQLHIERSPQ